MSQYDNLKATIASNVYENHRNLVTANGVKAAMNAMTDSLGTGYQYLGIATPTSPGTAQTPDQKVFYIATTPGTYTYLGGLVVNDGEVAVLKWDTAWHKEVTGAATAAQVTELGQYVDNPEWVKVVTDTNDRILYGVKTDGKLYFGAGCPPQVQEYIQAKIDELSLDEYDDIVTFLGNLIEGDTLATLLDGKVDKEMGKSLIDADFASSQEVVENPEWLEVTTDSEGKVLGGRKKDGTLVENCDVKYPNGIPSEIKEGLDGKVEKEIGKTLVYENVANSQFVKPGEDNLQMVVDSELRIIDYKDKDGKNHLAYPTNQDDIIQEQVDSIVNHVYPNLSAIVSPQEFNRVKEDKCNNNIAYLLYSNQTNPFGNPQVIKNGKFVKDFSGRSTIAKICLFGDTHFGNTITGTFVLDPTIEERCGVAFIASNSKNADFSIILGDIYEESYDHEINKQIYALYHQKLDLLETPCFPIEGNHDEEMLEKDGPEFTNELTKTGIIQFNNVRIICFNAKIHYNPQPGIEDVGDVSDEVYEWLEDAVKDSYNNGFITILACHYELAFDANDSYWDEPIGTHRDDIIQLCADYDVKLYLNGHEHIPNLIYKNIITDGKILTNIEFGRTALSYSVMEIKDGANGEGFYFSEYETLTDDLANTLFVPMELTNVSQIIKVTYKELTPLSRN